jgi:hypothetical protein
LPIEGVAGHNAARPTSLPDSIDTQTMMFSVSENVGLGFDDTHRKAIEGLHYSRSDRRTAIGRGHIPKLPAVTNGHQDR